MVDEQEPAKRVVKRVVKKAVVRPAAPVTPAQAPPRVRYGRPVSTTTSTTPAPKTPLKVQTRHTTRKPSSRERIDVRDKIGVARERVVDAWWIVADGTTDGIRAVGSFGAERSRRVVATRLPHINSSVAAAITGAVVGIVSVALGILSLAIFDGVRGVSSGGGLWGGLSFVAIAVVAGWLGATLLRGFGSTSGALTSFLAVVLTIVAILGLFLDLADTWAAVVLIPALGITAFSLSRWLIDIAENTPPEID